MAIIKCKICGGDMELSADQTVATCEYCGSTMTIPKVDDDQRAAAFNRGNHFRRIGEFDKALAVYERIVQEDETDAEAHWCCALCRFGIEYVKDPATDEYLPTCHRVSFDSFLEDVDYLAAVNNAGDALARAQYERDAEKIAEVQRGILSTVQKEQPFDVFICYKESDENGRRTVDSTLAQDVYYQLTEQGRRVFFARITLEDKAGQEYEPYIFAALNSAKVMVVVGTKPEYLNAVWVKNEWSRYLAIMKRDRKRLLIPCYRDMDPYDMPEQLSVLQSYDMSRIGFIQDLIRGIAKVLDADKPKEQPRETTTVIQNEGGANQTALLKRGNMALEDGEWQKADDFFEQVLNMDAECAEGYWGKALAAHKCRNGGELAEKRVQRALSGVKEERLTACGPDEARIAELAKENALFGYLAEDEIRVGLRKFDLTFSSETPGLKRALEDEKASFAKDRNLSRALKFANGEFREKLASVCGDIERAIRDRIDESARKDEETRENIIGKYQSFLTAKTEEMRKNAENTREQDYNNACMAQKAAKSAFEYHEAAKQFKKLDDYLDSAERTKACEDAGIKITEDEERQRKIRAQQAAKKKKRVKTILSVVCGVVALAIAFSIIYKNIIVPSNKYKKAEAMLAEGDNNGAAFAFGALGDYKDSHERSLGIWDKIAVRETVSAGGEHTVGLKSDGTVVAVGYNRYGQCDVSEWTDIVAISASYRHTVGLKLDGTVVAVGRNYDGQCDVSGWTDIVAVSAGGWHTVGLKSDGTVVAVGDNNFKQCDVSRWTDIVAISAGSCHTVGLKSDGTVVAVGKNDDGQCNVSDWTDIVAVSAGDYHTVGLKSDGTVVAVGWNEDGQCDVSRWTDIVAVSASFKHTVGLKSDGTVVAVGSNGYGQCNVSRWTDIVAISAGDEHTVGLKADGTVVAVGKMINGTSDVLEWTDIVAISAGDSHAVGLKSDSTVVAVGYNGDGQCDVSGWSDIVAITKGNYHTVGLKSDGTVVAVGYNYDGQCDVSEWSGWIKMPSNIK